MEWERKLFVLIRITVGCAILCVTARAQLDDLEVILPPAAREYCHLVRFPQGWAFPRYDKQAGQQLMFGSSGSDYEFRVDGILGTRFLVAGFTDFVGTKYYTANRYEIDLSDPTASIDPASRKRWDTATVVPLGRKSAFSPGGTVSNDATLKFHGFEFNRTGAVWGQPSGYATRLSPDAAWIVLLSTTPATKNGVYDPYGTSKVFYDFYNADTGQKIFTIEGTFSSIAGVDADGAMGLSGWLTERYFVAQLGRKIERCLVCDFGHKKPRIP
jgi:hypothetical protein